MLVEGWAATLAPVRVITALVVVVVENVLSFLWLYCYVWLYCYKAAVKAKIG
jgi:hypothetical protein